MQWGTDQSIGILEKFTGPAGASIATNYSVAKGVLGGASQGVAEWLDSEDEHASLAWAVAKGGGIGAAQVLKDMAIDKVVGKVSRSCSRTRARPGPAARDRSRGPGGGVGCSEAARSRRPARRRGLEDARRLARDGLSRRRDQGPDRGRGEGRDRRGGVRMPLQATGGTGADVLLTREQLLFLGRYAAIDASFCSPFAGRSATDVLAQPALEDLFRRGLLHAQGVEPRLLRHRHAAQGCDRVRRDRGARGRTTGRGGALLLGRGRLRPPEPRPRPAPGLTAAPRPPSTPSCARHSERAPDEQSISRSTCRHPTRACWPRRWTCCAVTRSPA